MEIVCEALEVLAHNLKLVVMHTFFLSLKISH